VALAHRVIIAACAKPWSGTLDVESRGYVRASGRIGSRFRVEKKRKSLAIRQSIPRSM